MRGWILMGAVVMALTGVIAPAQAQPAAGEAAPPPRLVIAHRGASALRPEHTLAAYAKALADGADYVEPDLVSTRDGVLVARHENEIGGTTDVAAHPEFAARRTAKTIDGERIEGWFSEDFTLAELKTLRARERLPQLRGTGYDGQFQVPRLDEIIDFVAAESATRGRRIGLIPEIKHGSYFARLGLAMEDRLLDTLAAHAYTRSAPVAIQSFEIGNLRYLHQQLQARGIGNVSLVQLIGDPLQRPGDVLAAGGSTRYIDMLTPAGLAGIAAYARYLSPELGWLLRPDAQQRLTRPTAVVPQAHAAGLLVVPYTFRPENQFLAKGAWPGGDAHSRNPQAMVAAIRAYLDIGIDGFFTDDPALGREAVDGWVPGQSGLGDGHAPTQVMPVELPGA